MASPQRVPRTQAQRREKTRARLLDATIACLAEHGYHATTNRRVAAVAGVSLGAMSHQFPSRLDLIATTLDEVGLRGTQQLGVLVAESGQGDTAALLDLLWGYFSGELFTVWIKVWLAAAEDEDLFLRLEPIERRLNKAIASIVASARPSDLDRSVWTRRVNAALHALRGLALQLALEPRASAPRSKPWPGLRQELVAMIDRR